MRFSEDYFYEKYRMLPKSIKRVMYSFNIHDIVKSIADKYGLHVDTAGILDDEIMYAIIGMTKVSDFIRNLRAQLKLPDEKINAIAKDVNEKIFLPIKESLKKAEKPHLEVQPPSGIQEQNEIHHPNLEARLPSEGEEIKKQIAKQQAVKPVNAPPPNLPTGALAESSKPKESNLEARLPSEGEEKKPAHIDPYREPID